MASLVVLGVVTVIVGTCFGAFLRLSFAIRREDRLRGVASAWTPRTTARKAPGRW